MTQFDKTQPIRLAAPRLDFGRGVYMVHVIGTWYAFTTQSGVLLDHIEAEEIIYESTLGAQALRARSIKQ